jgi:hypothetical protein
MRRIFGAAKKEAPPPTLDETGQKLQGRGDQIDENIAKLDAQLVKFREQIAKTRPGEHIPDSQLALASESPPCIRTNTGWHQEKSSPSAKAEEAL